MQQPTADEISHPLGAGVTTQLKDIEKTLPLRVLSEDDWRHWITKGYVIVRGSVPRENCERLAALLWEFDDKNPNDPATWYAAERRAHVRAELNNAGMVEIYNHQFLWDNRQEQRIYDAFVPKPLLTASNCPKFTASLGAMPSATFVTLVPAALMPAAVILGAVSALPA